MPGNDIRPLALDIESPSRFEQTKACANNLATREFYKLHILVDKHPEGVGIVDIVAIHGPSGHDENTWTTKRKDGTPVNWLQDLLPKHVRNARIMSISYTSGAQSSKYTSDVFVFVDQMLERVMGARTTSQEIARPIIFICHGLGGVIFKQVLNEAHENNRYASAILPRVVGVAFFGTPHRGSDMVHWSRMLETGDLPSTARSQLTEDFELDFNILEHISKSFIDQGKKLKIFSFFETENVDFMNSKVVEPESATLDWPNETRMAITGNHWSMAWFTEEEEARFEPVWMCINEMASNAIYLEARHGLFQSAHKFLSTLQTSDYETHKGRNPTAAHGTCAWIVNHVQYQSWLAEANASLLWVSGDAGCGKSVLASFLVDYHKSKRDSNVCYFFFRTDNSEQREALQGLSALLHQLYTSQPQLIQHAQRLLGEAGQNLNDLATLWRLITEATENPHAQPTILFIDGLDECDEIPRKQLIRLISEYFATAIQQGKRKKGPQKKLKLLVTSRPDNSITNAFSRGKATPATARNDNPQRITVDKPYLSVLSLRGEDETKAIGNDIKIAVKYAMEELSHRGHPPIDILEAIEGEILSRGDVTFLWVALAIELLKQKAEGGVSRSDLEVIVKSKTIYAIYEVLLNSSTNEPIARTMFSIILAAVNPLTVEELSIALAVIPDHKTFEQTARPRRPSSMTFNKVEQKLAYPFENHIKGLCGPLVRIIQKKVYVVHQTARDFLLDPETLQELDEPFRIDNGCGSAWQHTLSFINAHSLLLEICVTYLYLLGKRPGTRGSVIGEPSPKTSAFLKYAATSWTTHFRQVRHKIRRRDLPYYEGLCHPMFPGFQRWLDVLQLSTAELVGRPTRSKISLFRFWNSSQKTTGS
ncbi:hypothetical protein E0Z10_g5673 [Xylaria hypoxylon]|uniref:NACHT domain-containing protein n=1 Tax=Xylaria hypoxylon TaxID=37992 RepID=A0A4Z0YI17_9PEZI|nr:hypothetical protein E0Z10_g5673 [Xylaria hypoxylon]